MYPYQIDTPSMGETVIRHILTHFRETWQRVASNRAYEIKINLNKSNEFKVKHNMIEEDELKQ